MAMTSAEWQALVPESVTPALLAGVTTESAVLKLGRVINMPSGISSVPVLSAVPVAGFVDAYGGRKPIGNVEWTAERIVAHDLAITLAIPDAFIEDSSFPVWSEIRPLMASAIAYALDNALLWGVGAPAGFPAGGVFAAAGTPVATGAGEDFADAVSAAMGQVEAAGLIPDGHAVGPRTGGMLRGLRDASGGFLFTPGLTEGAPNTLYGLPIAQTPAWDSSKADLITGDWDYLVIGIRTDIAYAFSSEGVLVDQTGAVVVNAFQDDSTIMRVHMRVGAAIGSPVTPASPDTPVDAFAAVAPAPVGP